MKVAEPRLLRTVCECGNIGILDKPSKAALRLCNKQIKSFIDATVTACRVNDDDLDALLGSQKSVNWHLTKLYIGGGASRREEPSPEILSSSLCAIVSQFPLLEELRMGFCRTLDALPSNIGELSHLKAFGIVRSALELAALPPSFGQLTALEKLELIGCNGLTLEGIAPIKHLKQLKHISVMPDNDLDRRFPEWICTCHFPLLENLRLTDRLTSLPPSIGNFRNLATLDITCRDGLQVSESISSLSSLKRLVLSSNQPVSLPVSASKLTALEGLEICPDMDALAPVQQLTGLTNLKLLNFEDILPDVVWKLTSLKALGLSKGRVTWLPDAISNLTKLEFLELFDVSFLGELPESIGYLSCLLSILLYGCSRLRALPESMGNLAALKRLDIEHCDELQTLPESFGNLKNLNVLRISSCEKFSGLPCSIGNLESLEHLYFFGNSEQEFFELPDTIGNLHALKVLEVYCCDIIHIPDSFADLILHKKWSLQYVNFSRSKLLYSGYAKQALDCLKYYGIYKEGL